MKKILKKIEKIWDLYIAPFFVNGMKQEHYFSQMRKKYGVNEDGTPSN